MNMLWLAAAYFAGIVSAVGIGVGIILIWTFLEFGGRKRRKGSSNDRF